MQAEKEKKKKATTKNMWYIYKTRIYKQLRLQEKNFILLALKLNDRK
jgi:hypothetical protein